MADEDIDSSLDNNNPVSINQITVHKHENQISAKNVLDELDFSSIKSCNEVTVMEMSSFQTALHPSPVLPSPAPLQYRQTDQHRKKNIF